MKFDINEVLADMLASIKENITDNWDIIKETLNDFFQRRKERLSLLTEFRLEGSISEEDFNSRLEDEKIILETELHTIAIIKKSIAQKSANDAIKVLENAVKVALGIII